MRKLKRSVRVAAILLLAGLHAMAAAAVAAQPAGQGWIREILSEDPACDPATIDALAGAARRGIEREVVRRENSVKPPSAAAELSCLGDLMSTNLDIAFPTGNLTSGLPGFLQGILSQLASRPGSGLSLGTIDVAGLAAGLALGEADPTRILPSSLCSFAQSRWSQATLPALGGFGDLSPLAFLPLLLGEDVPVTNFPAPDLRRRFENDAGGGPGQASRILGIGGNQ